MVLGDALSRKVGLSASSWVGAFWRPKAETGRGTVGKVMRNGKGHLDFRSLGDRGDKEMIFHVRRILPWSWWVWDGKRE